MIKTLLLMGLLAAGVTAKTPRQVLDAALVRPCLESTVRVSLVVHVDGSWAVALPPGTESTSLRCVEQALRASLGNSKLVAPATASVFVRVVDGEALSLRSEQSGGGGVGAVCAYGRGNPLNSMDAAPCREGLKCCAAGGTAGANSVCMALGLSGQCPPYP